jgi:CRP-like cAMP-binding protein
MRQRARTSRPLPDEYRELAAALRDVGRRVVKPPGTALFRQGQPSNGVFVIRSGKVRLFLSTLDGDIALGTVGTDHILGLSSTVSNRVHRVTAETVEQSDIAWITRDHFLELLRRQANLMFLVATALAHELEAVTAQLTPAGGVEPGLPVQKRGGRAKRPNYTSLCVRCSKAQAEKVRKTAKAERRTVGRFILNAVLSFIARREKQLEAGRLFS